MIVTSYRCMGGREVLMSKFAKPAFRTGSKEFAGLFAWWYPTGVGIDYDTYI